MKAENLIKHLLLPIALIIFLPGSLAAQSSDGQEQTNPVVEELEKNLEAERLQLEGVLKDREEMLAEQAGIRDQLAAEKRELEEKKKALMELCEQHNSVNTANPMDCDAEVGN